jgi:PucR C-terminal helix-turn-helix domain
MRHIRHSVLGGLDSMPENQRAVLLDALETCLDTGGSSDAAAARLFCHPNTIHHRLRRLETRLGADCARRGTLPTSVSRSPPSASPQTDASAVGAAARLDREPFGVRRV